MNAARHWLAQASPQPHSVIEQWDDRRPATLLVGRTWDVAQIDFTLSAAAIRALRERRRHVGPYLANGMQRTTWWLLPPGTGSELDGVGGVSVLPHGRKLLAPPPGIYTGTTWILPLREGRRTELTQPHELHQALNAARSNPQQVQ